MSYLYLLSLQLRKPYSLLNVGIQSLSHLRKEGHDISILASLDESRLAFSSIGPIYRYRLEDKKIIRPV